MTEHTAIIQQLTANWQDFEAMLIGITIEEATFKPAPDEWCLLEVVCHLLDEEREDFRARLKHVLETPDQPLPPLDVSDWPETRNYLEQDYQVQLSTFLEERAQSVVWLQGLQQPAWDNACQHPDKGPLTADFFLANWLAHDYHHLRQINRIKYQYLRQKLTDHPLDYAGNW